MMSSPRKNSQNVVAESKASFSSSDVLSKLNQLTQKIDQKKLRKLVSNVKNASTAKEKYADIIELLKGKGIIVTNNYQGYTAGEINHENIKGLTVDDRK